MSSFLKKVFRSRKDFVFLMGLVFLAVVTMFSGYFVSSERSFDERSRASFDFEFTFSADPTMIAKSGQSTLTWNAVGAYRCWGFEGWTGTKDTSGSEVVSPASTTVYGMSCSRDDYELTRWVVVNVEGSSSITKCKTDADCRKEAPYEICFEEYCLRGDVNNDASIGMPDFQEFKKDFVSFKKSGWAELLKRSDFNMDEVLSMADYSIFVRSYRMVNRLD